MFATLITDASHSGWIGTWAAWTVSDNQRHTKSGILKGPIRDSNEAELKAIANGLALTQSRFPEVKRILIQSDSLHALWVISGRITPVNPAEIETKKLICKRFSGIRLLTKHVKGHTRCKDARSFVNRWCDKECRRLLNIARSEARCA